MTRLARPKAALIASDDERHALERLTKRAQVNRQLAFRARLLLACANRTANNVVARRYRTTNATVGNWRNRFIASRLNGLYHEPPVGPPRTVSDDAVEAVIIKTLETNPGGRRAGAPARWRHRPA